MVEVVCEIDSHCNFDNTSYKAYLSRWMAATVQVAPFTEAAIMKQLKASAMGAAGQCSGGANGRTCGRLWPKKTWDGKAELGEQMSALSVIQATLVQNVKLPPTANATVTITIKTGPNPLEPLVSPTIASGYRVGAPIRTALALSGCLLTAWFMHFF